MFLFSLSLIGASVSEETRKYSLFQLVDKSTKRIIAKAARSSGSEATRKVRLPLSGSFPYSQTVFNIKTKIPNEFY